MASSPSRGRTGHNNLIVRASAEARDLAGSGEASAAFRPFLPPGIGFSMSNVQKDRPHAITLCSFHRAASMTNIRHSLFPARRFHNGHLVGTSALFGYTLGSLTGTFEDTGGGIGPRSLLRRER